MRGEIVKAVSEAVDIPVTVKIRKGWDDESITAVELAQIAEKKRCIGNYRSRKNKNANVFGQG
ncbi:MAG: tRNA-dihydrouridine synthase [Eubacterium sp.]